MIHFPLKEQPKILKGQSHGLYLHLTYNTIKNLYLLLVKRFNTSNLISGQGTKEWWLIKSPKSRVCERADIQLSKIW